MNPVGMSHYPPDEHFVEACDKPGLFKCCYPFQTGDGTDALSPILDRVAVLHQRRRCTILMTALFTCAALTGLMALTISVESKGNFKGQTERPLRYRPEGTDFVIENGKEFFNRPLYSPFVSLAIPKQGIGSWVHWNETFEVDDAGLRAAAGRNGGRFVLPQGVPFKTPGTGDAKNIAFTSQWDNYPREIAVPLSGRASHVYLLMAGSTNQMQSRFDNGEVIITYADGSTERLALHNPTTW